MRNLNKRQEYMWRTFFKINVSKMWGEEGLNFLDKRFTQIYKDFVNISIENIVVIVDVIYVM